jgi:hypothetical protein
MTDSIGLFGRGFGGGGFGGAGLGGAGFGGAGFGGAGFGGGGFGGAGLGGCGFGAGVVSSWQTLVRGLKQMWLLPVHPGRGVGRFWQNLRLGDSQAVWPPPRIGSHAA